MAGLAQRHGWGSLGRRWRILVLGGRYRSAYWAEARGNPLLAGVNQQVTATQPGGNMEGKEVRFGITNSALFATVTTDASCGAINGWHDSFMPLGGMVPLVNIMLSEVIFGGVGSGMYGMLIYVVLTVFIAGLMVGRTPEYLGKKIEAYDVKMAMLVALIFPLVILIFTGISTGESAPVIREAGGDRSAVTGGTRVLSDQIKVKVTSNPGETFLDRMIALVEGAERQKTPNEIALNILLAGL